MIGGRVVSLEMDSENMNKMRDFLVNNYDEWQEIDVPNEVFVLDSELQLTQLKQLEDGKYEVIEK